MKNYPYLLFLVLFTFSHVSLADEYVDSLESVKIQIAELESNPEYLEHIEKVQSPFFLKKYFESQTGECITAFEKDGFELAIGISNTGVVERVYLSIETKVSKCLKAFFLKQNFPKPIVSPMYIYMNIL